MTIEFIEKDDDASNVRQMAIKLAVLAATAEDNRIIKRGFEVAREMADFAALLEHIGKEKAKNG